MPSQGATTAKPPFAVVFEDEINKFILRAPDGSITLPLHLKDINELACGRTKDYPLGTNPPSKKEEELYLKLAAINAAFSLRMGKDWDITLGIGFSDAQKRQLQIIKDVSQFVQEDSEVSETERKPFAEGYMKAAEAPQPTRKIAPDSVRYINLAMNNRPLIDSVVQSVWTSPTSPTPTETVSSEFRTKYFTAQNLTDYAKTLYSDLPQSKPIDASVESFFSYPTYKYYYNDTGYESGYANSALPKFSPSGVRPGDTMGDLLTSKAGDPIGYNIYIPDGTVKAVVVNVYGGGVSAYQPHGLTSTDTALLSRGVSVINLNLIDLKELSGYQGDMPEQLYNRVQSSIHDFWETLTKTPDRFGATLKVPLTALKDKPIFLTGGSFGGRVTTRHAELYRHTYNGYISVDGGFFTDTASSSGHLWLNAVNQDTEIQKLADPVLFIQNYDDNRIRPTEALNMYKKAQTQGKGHIVRLWMNREGSPLAFGATESTFKGHHPSSDPKIFGDMMGAILQFVEQSKVSLMPLHMWREHKYSSYYRFENEGVLWPIDKLLTKGAFSPTDWFLKDAYGLYKNLPPLERKAFVKELRALVSKTLTENSGVPVLWNRYMDPIMCSIPIRFIFWNRGKSGLQSVMSKVFSEKALEHQIRRTIRFLLPGFMQYIKERFGASSNTSDPNYVDKMANDPESRRLVMETYFAGDSNLLLNAYLRANTEAGPMIVRSQAFPSIIKNDIYLLIKLAQYPEVLGFLSYATEGAARYPKTSTILDRVNDEDNAGMGAKMQKALLDIIEKESTFIKRTFKEATKKIKMASTKKKAVP